MNIYDSDIYKGDLEIAACASIALDQLKGKTILITGATGTIGSFLVDLLIHYNYTDGANIKIYAMGRSIERLHTRFDKAETINLIYIEQNLLEPFSYDFDVDYVIHAAGNAYPAAFNSDPVGTIVGNIIGTYNLLEYCRIHEAKRFLYISSGEVYGQGDLSLNEFEETYGGYVDPTSPRSCYPNSKRMAETLCASYYNQYGLETVIVRPCHTYGPVFSEKDNRANVQFFSDVIEGNDIVMTSPGNQLRSYCYVADCASAIFTVLFNGKSGEAYNSANPNARITIAGFAKVVADAAGKKVIIRSPSEKEIAYQTPIEKQVLSSKKLEDLGWSGNYTVERGVKNTIAILKGE